MERVYIHQLDTCALALNPSALDDGRSVVVSRSRRHEYQYPVPRQTCSVVREGSAPASREAPGGVLEETGTAERPDDYLTVAELAARLKVAAKTVRNHMYDGTWTRGIHWFSPPGIGPRFSWVAIERWLRGRDVVLRVSARSVDIPLSRVGGRRRRRADREALEPLA